MTGLGVERRTASEPAADDATERPRHRWATPAAWVVFALCAAYVLISSATHDFRDEPLAGDTSAHLMQALSVAYDSHSFNFDARDLENWKELGWAAEPVGMFFQRYDRDRYGAAKPYGYSLYAGPFIAVFGPVRGIALANTVLLGLMMAISIALLRTRFRGPVVPLTVGAFFLASYAYMYAFWIHSELFLGLVSLLALAAAARFAQTGKAAWALLAFAVMGFGMSEKAAYLGLFAPIGLVMLWKARSTWLRIAMPLTALAVFAVAVLPYLRYSDWQSFTPYGGDDRLYVQSATPFAGGTTGFASTTFEASSLTTNIRTPVDDKLKAALYTVVGRHTGMLVYLPLALLLIGAAIARFPRADAWGRAALVSVLGYIAFYAVMFPTNYFGGGQSLGNSYFLQMAPAILVLPVLMGVSRRVLLGCSLAGAVLGLALLWPQHMHPRSAHVYIEKTTAVQRLLPVESNQDTAGYFRCEKRSVGDVTVCE